MQLTPIRGITIVGIGLLLAFTASARPPSRSRSPSILPSGLGSKVDRDVARARSATRNFRQVKAAIAAGYVPTDTCVADPAQGAMGLHYKKVELRDGTLDVARPEILLFIKTPDNRVRLTGAEYVVPFEAWKKDRPPEIFGQSMHRVESLGIWDLHVWFWEPNPSGLFADWNPALTC